MPFVPDTNGTVMCKSLACEQLTIARVFGLSGWPGQVVRSCLWRHRRATDAVILVECYGQGALLFSVTGCLAFSHLCRSMPLLACIGFSAC
ncbi:hypothetical protein LCGC14_3008920, partial [marine sediment metagenome]